MTIIDDPRASTFSFRNGRVGAMMAGSINEERVWIAGRLNRDRLVRYCLTTSGPDGLPEAFITTMGRSYATRLTGACPEDTDRTLETLLRLYRLKQLDEFRRVFYEWIARSKPTHPLRHREYRKDPSLITHSFSWDAQGIPCRITWKTQSRTRYAFNPRS